MSVYSTSIIVKLRDYDYGFTLKYIILFNLCFVRHPSTMLLLSPHIIMFCSPSFYNVVTLASYYHAYRQEGVHGVHVNSHLVNPFSKM